MRITFLKTTLAFFLLTLNVTAQTPPWLWAKKPTVSGIAYERSTCVTFDHNGNTIIAGYFFSPSVTFGSTVLTNSSGYNDMFLVKYDPSGNVIWAKGLGGTSTEIPGGVVTDSNGNIYVTGSFAGSTISFASSTLNNSNSANTDMFLLKYDSTGNELWGKRAGGSQYEHGKGIAIDAHDNIIVAGYFSSTSVNFGTKMIYNTGIFYDAFVVKYDSAGVVSWAKSAGGNDSDYLNCVAADAEGNVYIGGNFKSSSMLFDTVSLTNPFMSTECSFLAKYSPSGNIKWARSSNPISPSTINAVAADSGGNVVVTGSFYNATIAFGATVLTNMGSSDMFVAKFDSSGNALWARQASGGGAGVEVGHCVTTDASGHVFVFGEYESPTVTFGTNTLLNAGTGNTTDLFLLKYDTAGILLWATRLGGTLDDNSWGVAADINGNVAVTGSFNSVLLKFGPITLIQTGGGDMFIGKMSSSITGIENRLSVNEVKLYPNPAHGSFYLEENVSELLKECRMEIINQLNQVVYSTELKSQQVMIDVSGKLKNGMYILKLSDKDNNLRYSGKIILE